MKQQVGYRTANSGKRRAVDFTRASDASTSHAAGQNWLISETSNRAFEKNYRGPLRFFSGGAGSFRMVALITTGHNLAFMPSSCCGRISPKLLLSIVEAAAISPLGRPSLSAEDIGRMVCLSFDSHTASVAAFFWWLHAWWHHR